MDRQTDMFLLAVLASSTLPETVRISCFLLLPNLVAATQCVADPPQGADPEWMPRPKISREKGPQMSKHLVPEIRQREREG